MNTAINSRPFFIALAISFVLLFIDYRYQLTQPLQYALNQSIVLPTRRVLGLPYNIYLYISDNLILYSNLVRDNQRLRTLNAELEVRLIELEALHLENRDIRIALNHEPASSRRFVNARVVQILFRQNRAILVINRTAEDGIAVDQMVVDRMGLVGRIVAIFQNNSHVQMISDNEHYVSAYTEGGVHTIVQGRGLSSDLQALYIPNFAEVGEDEQIYSSGLEGIYPARFPIGRIVSVEHNTHDDFSTVFVRPQANLQSSRELYVLIDAIADSGEAADESANKAPTEPTNDAPTEAVGEPVRETQQ